nr:TnsD family Tn7-like transposition protein [Ferroacidibacillus organovorans]
MNAGALHFKENVIEDCIITRDYKSSAHVGTFRCHCGFVYSRRGPDQSPLDRFKIGRIKAFGSVWQNALREKGKDPSRSLRSIARSMMVDVGTVKKYLQLDVKGYSPDSMKRSLDEDVRDKYRIEWLRLLNEYPNLSVTGIRKLSPKIYTKLYRYDRTWLLHNKTAGFLDRSYSHRVDWSVRDQEILLKITRTIETIVLKQDKPMRLTISSIGKLSGTLALLQKNMDKLPKTAEYLYGIVESVEEFQIRRIQLIAKQLHQSNKEVLSWRIMRAAGIRSTVNEHVRCAITNEVNRYTNFSRVEMENENIKQGLAIQKR